MNDSSNNNGRVVRITGVNASGNQGHGLHVPPKAGVGSLVVENSSFCNNGGSGINLSDPTLSDLLELPRNIDERKLAELLLQVQQAPAEQRPLIIEESSLFQTLKGHGVNALDFAGKIAALCDSASVVALTKQLLGL